MPFCTAAASKVSAAVPKDGAAQPKVFGAALKIETAGRAFCVTQLPPIAKIIRVREEMVGALDKNRHSRGGGNPERRLRRLDSRSGRE